MMPAVGEQLVDILVGEERSANNKPYQTSNPTAEDD